MTSNAIAAAQAGISETSMLFYTIGGSSLVCLAAIWAFNRIVFLFSVPDHGSEDYQNYRERKRHDG